MKISANRLLPVFFALLLALGTPAISNSQTLQPAANHANGWLANSVVAVNQSGITSLGDGVVGDGGRVALYGIRNNQSGIFALEGSNVITVAVQGVALPGSLGTLSAVNIDNFAVDATGDVWFEGQGSGEGLSAENGFSVFRWHNGTINRVLAANGRFNYLATLTNNGKWLAALVTPVTAGRSVELFVTNGASHQSILKVVEEDSSKNDGCRSSNFGGLPQLNENNVVVYNFRTIQRTKADSGCTLPETTTHTLKMTGAISQTIATASHVRNSDNSRSGATVEEFALNNDNTVVYKKLSVTGNDSRLTQLIQQDASGSVVRMEAPFTLSSQSGLLIQSPFLLDNAKRLAFQATLDGSKNVIYAGGNLSSDLVIGEGDTLFEQTLTSIDLLDVSLPSALSVDSRAILFAYTLADGKEGFALAAKGVSRWTNPSGGDWATAANWIPAEVPGGTAETLFDLEASYDVTVGSRQSGRALIQNGSVAFRTADLELVGPLHIANDALLTVPEGKIEISGLVIGALPPTSTTQAPVARLNLSNGGTIITDTGETLIGNAGDGELFISGGSLSSAAAQIGAGSTGTVTVGLPESSWHTGNLAIGAGHGASLNLERGAQLLTLGEVVLGGGATLQNGLAVVSIDAVNAPLSGLPNWLISDTLTIGDNMIGQLHISAGGSVSAFSSVQIGTKSHGLTGQMDGSVEVFGTGSPSRVASNFSISEDLLMGMATGSKSEWIVRNGATSRVIHTLSLAHESGSEATMVLHRGAFEQPDPELEVGDGDGATRQGDCLIGQAGKGTLRVEAGAYLVCNSETILGVLAGSFGQMIVTGNNDDFFSTVDTFFLCVGYDAIGECNNQPGARGLLQILDSGYVEVARGLLVGNGGIVSGNGTLNINGVSALGMLVENGGILDPGINLTQVPLGSSQSKMTRSTHAIQAGTLTITGSLAISPSAAITIDVLSKTDYDQLVINGGAQLGGKLALNFGNGYAPKAGDSFTFVHASSSTGSFASVAISGLADGFQFDVKTNGGSTQLIAKNDGISITQPDTRNLYLPLVAR